MMEHLILPYCFKMRLKTLQLLPPGLAKIQDQVRKETRATSRFRRRELAEFSFEFQNASLELCSSLPRWSTELYSAREIGSSFRSACHRGVLLPCIRSERGTPSSPPWGERAVLKDARFCRERVQQGIWKQVHESTGTL